MTAPITIHAELRLPPAFLQHADLEEVEHRLRAYHLLPAAAAQRRWRMDPAVPGGYVLTFTFALVPLGAP